MLIDVLNFKRLLPSRTTVMEALLHKVTRNVYVRRKEGKHKTLFCIHLTAPFFLLVINYRQRRKFTQIFLKIHIFFLSINTCVYYSHNIVKERRESEKLQKFVCIHKFDFFFHHFIFFLIRFSNDTLQYIFIYMYVDLYFSLLLLLLQDYTHEIVSQ